jgi:hypothetical protein
MRWRERTVGLPSRHPKFPIRRVNLLPNETQATIDGELRQTNDLTDVQTLRRETNLRSPKLGINIWPYATEQLWVFIRSNEYYLTQVG